MNISNEKITLPFSAKKRCRIKMGPKQVAVSSAALCPHSTVVRVISIKDIRLCLGVGAVVTELRNDNIETKLTINNFSEVFDEAHFEFLKQYNANIKTPVEKRESYLIDIPEKPIPPKKEEKKEEEKVEETTAEPAVEVTEPEKVEEVAEALAPVEPEETPAEEVTTSVESEETESTEEVAAEEPVVEAEAVEESSESEETLVPENTTETYNNYNRNKKRNRH